MSFFVNSIQHHMKKTLNITSLVFVSALFFSSCSAKKQNCDAYGAITKIEKVKELNKIKKSISTTSEENS